MNDIIIESLLFKQVSKPEDYLMTRVINVYDNRYRVNIYCEKEEDSLVKKKICASYFCHFSNNHLDIIDGNPMPSGLTA
jgi:hypothetical protein